MASYGSKSKINFKDMALGAGAMTVLMLIPAIGDAVGKMVVAIRSKITGRK